MTRKASEEFIIIRNPYDLKAPGCEVPVYQLLQWKYAIHLETVGLRHSSGRSVRKHAALKLGLPPRTNASKVLAEIESVLSRLNRAIAPEPPTIQ